MIRARPGCGEAVSGSGGCEGARCSCYRHAAQTGTCLDTLHIS